ncbi:hypothetical protein MHAS44199_19710 [Mycolicibacterium hassiacum DSM 44199]|nr:hypothetical protein [Mycolicibacterium hassiacum DSM 44199]
MCATIDSTWPTSAPASLTLAFAGRFSGLVNSAVSR